MKQFAKIMCIAALSVAAYGCGGGTPTTPDTGGGTPGKDAGPTCTAAKKCGSACCGTNQECIDDVCTDCECQTDSWECGTDSCGNVCGTCTDPKVCQASTHTCKGTADLCNPNPCSGETPDCDATDGSCNCNGTSCTGGKTCNAATGQCESTSQCNAATEEVCGADCCTKATEKCVNGMCATCGCPTGAECGKDACGISCGTDCTGGKVCNANNKCVATGDICLGITCAMAGEECKTTDGQCHCTVGGTACATGYKCDATLLKCIPDTTDKCAGKTCDPTTPCNSANGLCECTTSSCGTGKTCNTTTKVCETAVSCVTAGCTANAELPYCNTGTGVCECTTSSCGSGKTCNTTTKVCETTGTSCVTTGCTANAELPFCNTGTGKCECTSGSCPTGKTCSATTKVCETTSTGCTGCTSGESCVNNACTCTPVSGTAKDTCNAASADFMCDTNTKRCVSAKVQCGGATCAVGQICADPADPLNGTNKMCTCLYARYADATKTTVLPDSCALLGQVCDYGASDEGPWTCKAPGEWDECTKWATPNCDTTRNPNLTCEAFPISGETLYACVQKCAKVTDSEKCPNPWDKCTSLVGNNIVCYTNECVDPEDGTYVPKDRNAYFKPCAADGASDGICLPVPSRNAAGTGLIDHGYCFQTGTATGACDPFADRLDLTKLCGQGKYCDATQINATKDGYQGVCRDVCNAAVGDGATINPTPAVNCASGGYCVDYSWMFGADSQTSYEDFPYALFGECYAGCNAITHSPDCSGSDALGNPLGCTPWEYDGTGYCTALRPNAKAAGAACGSATTCTSDAQCGANEVCGTNGSCVDFRKECAGSTECSTASKTCEGWCDSTTCAAGATCASCQPTGHKCTAVTTGQKLGLCGP